MITRFKIFEKNEDIDPFGEENWEEEESFKKGDILICIDNTGVRNLLLNGEYVCVSSEYIFLGRVYIDVIDEKNRKSGVYPRRFKKKSI